MGLGIFQTIELGRVPCGCDSDVSQFVNQTMSRKQLMMTTSTRKEWDWNDLFLKCKGGSYIDWMGVVGDARSRPTDISSYQQPPIHQPTAVNTLEYSTALQDVHLL